MPITFLNRARGRSYVSFDSDALAWYDQVRTNGGDVSYDWLNAVSQFVFKQKAGGAGPWYDADEVVLLVGETPIQSRTTLKRRVLASVVNSPVHTALRDYTFNGSNYYGTGFIPATHGVKCTGSNQRIAAYERTNVASGAHVTAGALSGGTNKMFITNQAASGNLLGGLNTAVGTPGNFTISPADSRALKAVSRAGGTTMLGFDRGVRKTDATGLITSNAGAPTHEIWIGGLNNGGALTNGRPCSVSVLVIGGPLSDGNEALESANIQDLMTAAGGAV